MSVAHSQKVILNYVKFNVSALYKSFEIATKRMKSQQIEEKSLVIADLLNSIIPEKKIESLISNHSKCCFFLDIDSYSIINPILDLILWLVFFVSMDIILFMQCLPETFFSSSNFFLNNGQVTNPSYMIVSISKKQTTILLSFLIAMIILFQWYKLFRHKPTKHLSRKDATILHLLFFYLPIVLTPYFGIVLGGNLVEKTKKSSLLRFDLMTGIFFLLVTFIFIFNFYFYSLFTNFSLVIKNRFFFGYWNSPFKLPDMLYFYIISTIFVFRDSKFDKLLTISGTISIFYGIASLFHFKTISFVNFIGKFFYIKFKLNAIFFGILTIVQTWIDLSFVSSWKLAITCFIFTSFISFTYLAYRSKHNLANFSINSDTGFSPSEIKSPNDAIRTLREASSSYVPIIDPIFLQYILKNKFSPKLLTDVVRLSFFGNFSLSSLTVPNKVLSPIDISSLRYMTFQYKLLQNMLKKSDKIYHTESNENIPLDQQSSINSSSKLAVAKTSSSDKNAPLQATSSKSNLDDPMILDVYHMLEHNYSRAEEMVDTFWTENDYKQFNLFQLGQAMRDISHQFSQYGSIYKQCKCVQDIWRRYANDVLAKPSVQKIERNSLNSFVFPIDHIYTYLITATIGDTAKKSQEIPAAKSASSTSLILSTEQTSEQTQPEKIHKQTVEELRMLKKALLSHKPEKTELEEYFKNFQNKNLRPLLFLFILSTVLIIVVAIVFTAQSSTQTLDLWKLVTNTSDALLIALDTSGTLLTHLDDPSIILPDLTTIQEALGLNIDQARIFKLQKITNFPYNVPPFALFEGFHHLFQFDTHYSTCPFISFAVLYNYEISQSATIDDRICYYNSTMDFINRMNHSIYSNLNLFKRSTYHSSIAQLYTLIPLFILLILFVLFYFLFDQTLHNNFLNAVAHISCSASNKNFTERTDFSFKFNVQFLAYLVLIACYIMLIFSHYAVIDTLKDHVLQIANSAYTAGLVGISIQQTLASIYMKILLNYSFPTQEEAIAYETSLATNYLNLSHIIRDKALNLLNYTKSVTHNTEFPSGFEKFYPFSSWRGDGNISYSTLLGDWAIFATENISSFPIDSFKTLYLRYIYINEIQSFFASGFQNGADQINMDLHSKSFGDTYITVVSVALSLIVLSFYLYLHRRKKTWYYGASLLLRRQIQKDQRFIIVTRQILENGKIPEYLDLLPFAAIIKDENNRIIDSNWRTQMFTKLTTRQLSGQDFYSIILNKDEMNIDPHDIEIKEYKNKENGQDLVVLREKKGIDTIKDSMKELMTRFNIPLKFDGAPIPKNNVVFLNYAVHFEIRLENGIYQPDVAFGLFNQIEKSFTEYAKAKAGISASSKSKDKTKPKVWEIQRISCSPMFYTAVCYYDRSDGFTDSIKDIFFFFLEFIEKTQRQHAIMAATFGSICLYSLSPIEDVSSINVKVVASGTPVSRSHEICLFGQMGQFYIDFPLLKYAEYDPSDKDNIIRKTEQRRKRRVTFANLDGNAVPDPLADQNNDDNDEPVDKDLEIVKDLPNWMIPIMEV